MKTNRWAATGTGALLVLSTLCTATASAATTSATSSPAPAATKNAFRSYGAGPVTLRGQDARVSFRGEKGDVVHLDAGPKSKGSTTQLKVGTRTVRARWDDFWKLPRSGDYTFSFTAPPGDAPGRELQLQKVRATSTTLDAKPVPGRRQPRGYLNAVSVALRGGERALLTSRDWRHTVLSPDGRTESLVGLHPPLEGGRPMVSVIVGARAPESDVADLLRETEAAHPGVAIGSYPFFKDGTYGANFVIRSEDPGLAARCGEALEGELRGAGFEPVAGGI